MVLESGTFVLKGLLLVVETGFNSARALEEARLLMSQMGGFSLWGLWSSELCGLTSSVHRLLSNPANVVPTVTRLS